MDFVYESPRITASAEECSKIENILLSSHVTDAQLEVGENCTSRFMTRYLELKVHRSKRYDYQRAKGEDLEVMNTWFNVVQDALTENGFDPHGIYNVDETGLMLDGTQSGIQSERVVTGGDIHRQPKYLQTGCSDYVTAIECIHATEVRFQNRLSSSKEYNLENPFNNL